MRVYEAIIKGLEGIGVDAAFGGAGENAASLLLALKHSSKIKPVIVRHEQAASSCASRPRGLAHSTCSPAWRLRCRIPIRCSRFPALRPSYGRAWADFMESHDAMARHATARWS